MCVRLAEEQAAEWRRLEVEEERRKLEAEEQEKQRIQEQDIELE